MIPLPTAVANHRQLLHELATGTAPGQNVTVPREWLLEALSGVESAEPPAPVPTLLTVHQAAARLDISISHLYHRAKDLPFTVKLGPRQLRFDPVGLAAWLQARPRRHRRAA